MEFVRLLLTLISTSMGLPPQNPVIGIYTQFNSATTSAIPASYVKFIEMSGAQVVPIFSFSSTKQVLAQM